MANTNNFAQIWQRELIETFIDQSYIAPFVTTNVHWLDAQTFNFTTMATGGYKEHSLLGGWNRSAYVQTNHPFTLEHDRDVEFFVDVREVDETNQTASIQNISTQFERTQATPERDAYFFSKVATTAISKSLAQQVALATWTIDNVLERLTAIIGKCRRYRNKGLILYVKPEIMDLLALSPKFNRIIEVTTLVQSGNAIQTRITNIDGVPLVEIIDDDRFYTSFDFTEGYKAATGAYGINVLAATTQSAFFVPKISSIYFFAPGAHTQGDGYLYQNRSFCDAFVFPNGKDGKIDSIFVDYDTVAVA